MKTRSNKIEVMVIDDHPVLRKGVCHIISGEPDMEVCGEAGSAYEAAQLLSTLRPTVVMTDISMDGRNGIELIKDVVEKLPGLPILVFSIHDETLFAERALRAGAKGYITKHDPPDLIIYALRKLARGETYCSESITCKLLAALSPKSSRSATATGKEISVVSLSARELTVLELIAKGLGTRRIAKTLNISVSTVETYRANIKEKLHLADANELISFAVRWQVSHT